jgi:hypothetical protein
MKITARTLLTVILALALAVVAAAQGNKPNIGRVEIVVKDIATKADIATVEPGETVSLPAATRVRLIMTALPTGVARGPLYPDTVFSDTARGAVTITRSNVENSTADLMINRTAKAGWVETIRFQINDAWVPAHLRTGSFQVRIDPATVGGNYRYLPGVVQPGGAVLGRTRADQLTRALYNAILMRDPDPGAAGMVDSIAKGGYRALVDAAVGIANSEESRERLIAQGTSAEARLESLYLHLLGLTRNQVDSSQWSSDLLRIADRRISDVVFDMVSSDRFRERFGL